LQEKYFFDVEKMSKNKIYLLIHNIMSKKLIKGRPLKTIKETWTWKNIKSIDLKKKIIIPNKILEKSAEKKLLENYILVRPKIWKPFLRSKPNLLKKDNLDPKIKPRKILLKK